MVQLTKVPQGQLKRDDNCPVCLCFSKELKDSIMANGEKSIVLPITDDEGNLIGLSIDGTEHLMGEDQDTQNTHSQDADGNLVITTPDGASTTYVLGSEDTTVGAYVIDAAGIGVAPVLDENGDPTGDTVTTDFSGLISSPHPDPVVDTDTWNVVTVNADGSITIQLTDADGPVAGSDPVVIPAVTCDCPTGVEVEKFDFKFLAAETITCLASTNTEIYRSPPLPEDGIYIAKVNFLPTDFWNRPFRFGDGADIHTNSYLNAALVTAQAVEREGIEHNMHTDVFAASAGDVYSVELLNYYGGAVDFDINVTAVQLYKIEELK